MDAPREEHARLADHGIITIRERLDETVGVGFDARRLDELQLFLRGSMFHWSTDESILDVASDGRGEEDRFLGNEAYKSGDAMHRSALEPDKARTPVTVADST